MAVASHDVGLRTLLASDLSRASGNGAYSMFCRSVLDTIDVAMAFSKGVSSMRASSEDEGRVHLAVG